MREVQANIAAKLPRSGYVVTFDLNDGGTDLHPKEKTGIGQRLARLALAKEYGGDVAWHGPLYKSARPNGKNLVLQFDPGAAEMKSGDSQPLRLFEVAGSDGVYAPATAVLKGNEVALSSASVAQPLTARYAWAPAPLSANFVNSEGLPAAPFRTDTQPVPPRK